MGWEKCSLPSSGPCRSAGRPSAVSLGCLDRQTDRTTGGVYVQQPQEKFPFSAIAAKACLFHPAKDSTR